MPWLRLGPAEATEPAGSREPSVRLVCFPHAGAGATSFARWIGLFPPAVILVRAQLPGREDVTAQPPLRQVGDAVGALLPQVAALTDGTAGRTEGGATSDTAGSTASDTASGAGPLALYGHSMGALVAFELARALTAAGRPPSHLFVSGRRAPHQPSRRPPVHRFPDDEFVAAMEAMGATDGVVPRTRAFLRYMVRVTRADLELSEEYGYRPTPRLGCPITAFYGTEDPVVDIDQVEAWRHETDAPFTFHTFTGGHFFHQRHRTAIVTLMSQALGPADTTGAVEATGAVDTTGAVTGAPA
ncbi:thioesterase [Frankia sp. R43]|nr:thioesterase [Frankia sp. R43]